jgi:UDP-glucose 4-epimerase
MYIVTGGAGYLGRHIVQALIEDDSEVLIIDESPEDLRFNLSKNPQVLQASITDKRLESMLEGIDQVQGIFHAAAKKSISESISAPEKYFQNNTYGTERIVEICYKLRIKNIVFTSSAAVYGNINSSYPIKETELAKPINPYGLSKLLAENHLSDEVKKGSLSAISLRCFNIVGTADPSFKPKTIDNVLPILVDAINSNKKFRVYGNDHDTRDGTCVRDYVNVVDVAKAHIDAMKFLQKQSKSIYEVANIATGQGNSVLDLIKVVENLSRRSPNWEYAEKRNGDPALVIGNSSMAHEIFGWSPKKSIVDSIRETLNAAGMELL